MTTQDSKNVFRTIVKATKAKSFKLSMINDLLVGRAEVIRKDVIQAMAKRVCKVKVLKGRVLWISVDDDEVDAWIRITDSLEVGQHKAWKAEGCKPKADLPSHSSGSLLDAILPWFRRVNDIANVVNLFCSVVALAMVLMAVPTFVYGLLALGVAAAVVLTPICALGLLLLQAGGYIVVLMVWGQEAAREWELDSAREWGVDV
jgi:hypothetical protein